MALDNSLNLPQMAETQGDKYITHNEDNKRLEMSIAGRKTIDFPSDANLTINASDDDKDEDWRYKFLTFTDTGLVLTAGRDVIFPAKGPEYIIKNSTAQILTLKISGQSGVALAVGATNRFYYDVTDMVIGP